MCWSCCASPPQRSARRLVRLMSWHLVANESRAMDGDLYGSIFISIYGGTTTPGPFLPRRAYRLPGSHSNPAPYRPPENGEPRRGREKHARGVLGLPGWHKTRDLPLSLCYPLTPRPAKVSCHGVPAGFVSPPLPPDIRQGGSARPCRIPSPEGVVHASAIAPLAEPRPPAHLLYWPPRCPHRSSPRRRAGGECAAADGPG